MDKNENIISPLDSRYREKLKDVAELVGEKALMEARVRVEVSWLDFLIRKVEPLAPLRSLLNEQVKKKLSMLEAELTFAGFKRIKAIESKTNHDVKAVEYFVREELQQSGADSKILALIHFGCTSEDINNTAYALILNKLRAQLILPLFSEINSSLLALSEKTSELSMISRTHGQPASPTTMGKELAVFCYRLARQSSQFANIEVGAKWNGAVGNYNAHVAACESVDWFSLSEQFVCERLKLEFNPLTTQIENHDSLIEYLDCIRRYNTILIGFCRDIWGYISLGYLRQKIQVGEVGSSTMPHKVNPIDFENAEGNLGIANALANHFGEKLLISRWQRDLSDSTVLRNLGVLIGHSALAYRSVLKGLAKIDFDAEMMNADLEKHTELLGEAIQSVMRWHGVVDAYERLKDATRGQKISKVELEKLVDQCSEIPEEQRVRVKKLSVKSYVGIAPQLARSMNRHRKSPS